MTNVFIICDRNRRDSSQIFRGASILWKEKNPLSGKLLKCMLTFVIFRVGRQFVFLLERTHPYSKLGVFHKGSLLSELCYTEKVIYSWGLAQHAFPGGQSTLPFFIRKCVPCVPLPCQLQVRILAFTRPVCSLGNLGYRGVTLKGVMEQMANLKTFCKCSGVSKKSFSWTFTMLNSLS